MLHPATEKIALTGKSAQTEKNATAGQTGKQRNGPSYGCANFCTEALLITANTAAEPTGIAACPANVTHVCYAKGDTNPVDTLTVADAAAGVAEQTPAAIRSVDTPWL